MEQPVSNHVDLFSAAAHLSGLTQRWAAPFARVALPDWLRRASPQLTCWQRCSIWLSQHCLTGLDMHAAMQSQAVTVTVLCRPHWRMLLMLWRPQTPVTPSAWAQQPTSSGSSVSLMNNLAGFP